MHFFPAGSSEPGEKECELVTPGMATHQAGVGIFSVYHNVYLVYSGVDSLNN